MHVPTQAFITKNILKVCQSSVPTKDTRVPVTQNILQKLINGLPMHPKRIIEGFPKKKVYLWLFCVSKFSF